MNEIFPPARTPLNRHITLQSAGWSTEDGINWTAPDTGFLHSWPVAHLLFKHPVVTKGKLASVFPEPQKPGKKRKQNNPSVGR